MVPFPKKKFGTIVLDPPWQYRNTSSRAEAENHYPTLPTGKLMCMPVEQLMLPNAHLYLWTTDSHLEDALFLMKTLLECGLAWIKN